MGFETSKCRTQRPPFQPGNPHIIDYITLSQPSQRFAFLPWLKSRYPFDVDIQRIQKQPAVRRIWAAIGRPVVAQHVQRIEADSVGTELGCEFDQAVEIAKIPDAPVARRPDAIELNGEQPATAEIAAIAFWRRDEECRS